MSSIYHEKFTKRIVSESESNHWDNAVKEWDISNSKEDRNARSECICGKERIRYLFEITNLKNRNVLFPIGSSCIKKFKRKDLNEVIAIKEKLFILLHAVEDGKYIPLNSEYFSRKLLQYLFNEGAFRPNQFNDHDGENDYIFMLDCFNQKLPLSPKQKSKVSAIILNQIKPYLESVLEGKIITSN